MDAVASLALGRAQMSISGQIGRQRIRRPTAGLRAFTIMGATPVAGRVVQALVAGRFVMPVRSSR